MKYRVMMTVEVAPTGGFVRERMLRVEVEASSEDEALSSIGTVLGDLASAHLRRTSDEWFPTDGK